MKCRICGNSALKREEYCQEHFISEKKKEFLDLTADGFFKWVEFFLKEYTPQESPQMHKDIVSLYFSLYNPHYVNRYNRQLEEIAYREAGKSTVLNFFIPLYILCNNGEKIKFLAEVPEGETTAIKPVEVKLREKFGVIASKTATLAEDFVQRMRNELSMNRRLQMFYGAKIEEAIDSETGQWSKSAFKFNDCWIMGVGSGQMIRGRVKGAYRPTFIIFDDIYDENNITDVQRVTIKKWFYGAAMNSLDTLNGKALLAGTILHFDTVLVECEGSSMWKTAKFYPMPLLNFKKLLKEHLVVNEANRVCKLPFDELPNEIIRTTKQITYFKELMKKEDWGLQWPQRHDLYYMATKFKDAVETASIDLFYQEYFHEAIDESRQKFKADYFQRIKGDWRVFQEFGYNWFECKELYDQPQIINIEFGLDLAGIGEEADNTVIQPTGALPDKRLIVFPPSYGKMASRDILKSDSANLFRYEKVLLDKQYIEQPGVLDETFRLYLLYFPSVIKVGVAGTENKVPEDIRLLFEANGIYCQVHPRPQNKAKGSKYERIRYTLLKRYETRSMFHCNGTDLLEIELEKLTKYVTDDLADALEVSAFNITFPAAVSYKQFAVPNFGKRRWREKTTVLPPSDWRVN